jgi:uncharacterized protein YgiM (DUF1202 family)
MSRRNIADEWKLQEDAEPNDQWKLEPAEQTAISQWELQEGQEQNTQLNDWQPVNYTRNRSEPRGNWLLPTLVGVALVAVIAYVAWIALERAGLVDSASPAPANTPEAQVTQPAGEAEPTPEPTATLPPPTPTTEPAVAVEPTPEPQPTVPATTILTSVIITEVNGVNARSAPNTTSDVIQVIMPGTTSYLLADEQPEWVQIVLPDNQRVWVSNAFTGRITETVTIDEANRRLSAAGLPLVAAPDGSTPVAPTAPITGTAPSTTTTTAPVTAGAVLTATINITAGLNARETPDLNGTVVELLAGNTSYPALARTADNGWVQIQLPGSRLPWVSAQFVTLSGDINLLSTEPATEGITPGATTSQAPTNTLPITTTAGVTGTAPAGTTPLTGTTSLTGTTALTGTSVLTGVLVPTPTPAVTSVDQATGIVSYLSGAYTRPTPDVDSESLELLAYGTAITVTGRTTSDEWLQLTLADGETAWLLANTVTLDVPVSALPVVNP